MAILMVTNWTTLVVTNWATFVPLENRQSGPVSNHEKLRVPFLEKSAETPPIFIVFFDKQSFQKNKRGPVSNH